MKAPGHWLRLLVGSPTQLELQHVVFNLVAGLCFAAMILFVGLDLAIAAPGFLTLNDIGFLLVFALVYSATRFGKLYTPTVHFASLAALGYEAINFFANEGVAGSSWISSIMVASLMAVFHKPKAAAAYGLGCLLIQGVCVVVEGLHTEWVHHYPTADGRILDLMFTFAFCGLLLAGIVLLVMWFYGASRDKAEEALLRQARSEERLLLAMEASLEGHWDWNTRTGTVFYSPTWKKMLGYQDNELENRVDLVQTLTPPEEWEKRSHWFDPPQATGTSRTEGEFSMRHKDGGLVDILARTVILRDQGGEPLRYVGTHANVTERNRILRELESSWAEAEKANRAKSEFLSAMSQELRTPMNAILGFGQILQRENLSPSQRDYTEEILGAGDHLLVLINEILDLARVERGSVDLSLEPVNAVEVAREGLDLVGPQAQEREVEMVFRGLPGLFVQADRVRLKQILVNLLSNAVKYNRPDGRVTLTLGQNDHQVTFQVEDTGTGIPAEQMANLFVPFHRLGRETGDIQGSGIGLAFSRRLAELMGGSIGVESALGFGSRFQLSLPATASVSEPVPVPRPPQNWEPRGSTGGAVLAIEDNPSNTKLLRELLALWGPVTLVTADNGPDGLEAAGRRRPDLVLLDINLPGMDGYEVLRRLRELPGGRIPVVAVTANAMPADLKRGQREGFDGYLTKPLQVEPFLEMVDQFLRKRKSDGSL